MEIIIQKFGGSSLADVKSREKAASHIVKAKEKGYMPVVVVSAMGRAGDPYATDTLIKMAEEEIASPDAKSLAFLMACGENLSAAIFALRLQTKGLKAVPLNGGMAGILTSKDPLDARITKINKDHLMQLVQKKWVPVVAGFQGINEEGAVTTLGRGGSDTTAVALGAALQATLVEIFTDVPGLMTADPRIVPKARRLARASYSEILQMAQEGAKVIHPRAVEIAMEFGVPIAIRSTYEEGWHGTIISHQQQEFSGEATKKLISGITHVKGLAQITAEIQCSELEEKMFETLAENHISIDLINIFPGKQIFTVIQEKADECDRLLEGLGVKARVEKGLAKITVIGAGMRGVPGVMARIVTALKKQGVPILQTADSHINISCLIREGDVGEAVCGLHNSFSLENSD